MIMLEVKCLDDSLHNQNLISPCNISTHSNENKGSEH